MQPGSAARLSQESLCRALPVMVILPVLIMTAIAGLAEPTGDMNNDSIAYHYLGPKVWLRDGVIRPVPDELPTSFPVIVETQYAALMSLGRQRAPGLFAVTSFISLLLITGSLALRLGLGTSGAWWTAALILTMPALYRGAYGGFIDVLYAGFTLAAARLAFDAEQPGHYALFGIFCGFAMGTKYTGLIAFVIVLFCSFLNSIAVRRQSYRRVVKYLTISFAVAVTLGSPAYLRNWILLDCPIYPPPLIFENIFHAKYLSAEAVHQFHTYILHRGAGLGRGLGAYLLLPFRLTYHTANFHGAGGIGLAPLALGPIGMISSRREWFSRALAILAFLLTTAWFLTQQESRFLIHVYVIAALFAVRGWQWVGRSDLKYGPALSGIVITISIIYGLIMIIPERAEDLHAVVSSSFEAKRRQAEIPFIESLDYLNANPSVSKVLILYPHVAAFYSDKPYNKPIGRWGNTRCPMLRTCPRF